MSIQVNKLKTRSIIDAVRPLIDNQSASGIKSTPSDTVYTIPVHRTPNNVYYIPIDPTKRVGDKNWHQWNRQFEVSDGHTFRLSGPLKFAYRRYGVQSEDKRTFTMHPFVYFPALPIAKAVIRYLQRDLQLNFVKPRGHMRVSDPDIVGHFTMWFYNLTVGAKPFQQSDPGYYDLMKIVDQFDKWLIELARPTPAPGTNDPIDDWAEDMAFATNRARFTFEGSLPAYRTMSQAAKKIQKQWRVKAQQLRVLRQQNEAAAKIQAAWRTAVSDPNYTVCIKRIQREFQELTTM